jgi:hypothetical protein
MQKIQYLTMNYKIIQLNIFYQQNKILYMIKNIVKISIVES